MAIHQLPTAAAWVQFQVKSYGVCGAQSDTGEGFLKVLKFPLPFLIPATAPYSLMLSSALYTLNIDSGFKKPTVFDLWLSLW